MQWNLIYEIIALACISILFVEAKPLQIVKGWIIKNKNGLIWQMLNCCLCSSFWISLAVTLDVREAAITAVVAELLHKKLIEGGI